MESRTSHTPQPRKVEQYLKQDKDKGIAYEMP